MKTSFKQSGCVYISFLQCLKPFKITSTALLLPLVKIRGSLRSATTTKKSLAARLVERAGLLSGGRTEQDTFYAKPLKPPSLINYTFHGIMHLKRNLCK